MGKVYADAAQFELLFGRMFDEITSAGSGGLDEMISQAMVIRFAVRDPDVELWVDATSAPVLTTFEPSNIDPTLSVKLRADVLHEVLLGTLPLGRAMLLRKLKVDGSKTKAMKLEPVLHAMQSAYPDLAAEILG